MVVISWLTLLLVALGQNASGPLPFETKQPQRIAVVARIEPARAGTAATLVIEATPQPGIHVYAPGNPSYIPVSVHVDAMDGVRPGKPVFPPGQPYVFGELKEMVRVYSGPFTIRQPLTRTADGPQSIVITGHVRYQACDDRICFPPANAPFTVTIPRPARPAASRANEGASSTR